MFQPSILQPSRHRFFLKQLGVVILLAACLIHPTVHSQDLQALEMGKPIERELAGVQLHSYQITLAVGQYLQVLVEQRGIDVTVALIGPDGKPLANVDGEARKEGAEKLEWVAAAAGSYQLNVQAAQKRTLAGKYEIRVTESRVATEQDRSLQEARQLMVEFGKLYRAAKYDEARARVEGALAIEEKALGPDHPDVAEALNNLATLYGDKGDYEKAEPLHQRALAIREKSLGPEHLAVARSLNNLANLYTDKGDYVKAEPLYQRSLSIKKKTLGTEHPEVAGALNNLATLYLDNGSHAKAEPLFQSALIIYEKTLGAEHPRVAYSINNLAIFYSDNGDYVKAEPLYQRALTIFERTLGPEHSVVGSSLHNLANLYKAKGDYIKAELLYQRSLTVKEKTLGPEHPSVASTVNNLANLYKAKGDYTKAELLYQRSLTIQEKSLGPEHPDVAASLNGFANLYYIKGDYTKAEQLYQRALAICEKGLGPEHADVGRSLHNLAGLYYIVGDYAKAEPLYQRALAIREKSLGPEHPDVAEALNNLANLYETKGELIQAVMFQSRANAVSESNISLNLVTGSERQKLAYLAKFFSESNQSISLHVQAAPINPAARNLALTTILQRKGRALDAMTDSFASLRRHAKADDQAPFDQLQETNAQLARLVLNGPQRMTPADHQAKIKSLEEQKEKLESDISVRSIEFHTLATPVTINTVQAVIPAQAALVEFFSYSPFNPKFRRADEQFGAPRYVAYVLRHQGEARWVELGEARAIDAAIKDLRRALRDPKRDDARRLSRKLDAMVMQPVRALLGDAKQILLSPDGALNLIPFAALVDERNHYLVEGHSISYLTSGRDLLRLQVPRQSKSEPLIVADPAFGSMAGAETQLATNIRPSPTRRQTRGPLKNFSEAYFEPLPETGREARTIKELLPQTRVLTKDQANETALKNLSAPSILHIATHGFFLQDEEASVEKTRSLNLFGGASDLRGSNWAAKIENPLLRSGLALPGFNQRKSGDDDGALTALEAAGLDLWGTKLVVLSACDTGVGEVKNGEGVYGLRRALVLAGSESQVMSLWKVSDYVTRLWMTDYYTGLKQGQGRGEALRQVQLKMLKSKERRHPFYWASFIQSGEWANLDGQR